MKLGVLQTDDVRAELVGEYGEYPDMFAALLRQVEPDLEVVVYAVLRGEYPEDIDEVDGYLITGSKYSVYEDLPWIHQLADFVRTLHARRKKLVGICFGHQMIAHALGGETRKSDKGWGVGRHTVALTDQAADYDSAGSEFSILVSHQDQVQRVAEGARVLASSDFCPAAMCQIDHHILSFQGHPEFVPGYSRSLLDIRREDYGEVLYEQGVESLAQPLDQRRVAQWIMDFYHR